MISSGNHIDANVLASFHINGAKLFWKSRMFSTRMERSVPLEDDTPSESDKFEKDSDSDEPLDLADEFDVTRSYRIFESLHRHHRQIESESFHALGPRGGSGGEALCLYTFVMMISGIGLHNRIWLNLILALIGAYRWESDCTKRQAAEREKGFGKVTTQEEEEEEEEDRAGLTSDSLPAVPRLRSMFPTTEENVCALVYANSGRDFDRAVEMLSQMVGQPPRVNASESPSSSSEPLSSASLSPQSSGSPHTIDMRKHIADLWNAINRCYGYSALRVAGDLRIRDAFPALLYASYILITSMFDHYASLKNAEFDDPASQHLLATLSQRSSYFSDLDWIAEHTVGDNGGSFDALMPYILNSSHALYALLLHHHRRAPWIRNTSDIVDGL